MRMRVRVRGVAMDEEKYKRGRVLSRVEEGLVDSSRCQIVS